MHAEIVAIGDELVSGQRLDTNSQWLSQRLGEIGVPVWYHASVGDDMSTLTHTLRAAIDRSPIVVLSGGLGPTADDLTRQAMAEVSGQTLELRSDVLKRIELKFTQRGRTMTPQNHVQAMFPAGSREIVNPHGTAPGIDLEVSHAAGSSRLFALPGVPAEMRQMWDESVRSAIRTMTGPRGVIVHHSLKCFGVGESQLEAMLPDLIQRQRDPQVGITVHRATITLRVTAAGEDEAACRRKIEPTLQTIHACLGSLVFGEEDDELQHAVYHQLDQRQLTLAICELGTKGIVTQWLRDVDLSQRLELGIVAHTLDQTTKLLDIPSSDHPPLAPADQARWMAERIRRRAGADLGLAIGPLPGSEDPEPRIYFGLALPTVTKTVDRGYFGHPDVVLDRAAKQALDFLRLELQADRS
jgi:nicotinamide-nucleotide amidase